jgi:hypothetical protein
MRWPNPCSKRLVATSIENDALQTEVLLSAQLKQILFWKAHPQTRGHWAQMPRWLLGLFTDFNRNVMISSYHCETNALRGKWTMLKFSANVCHNGTIKSLATEKCVTLLFGVPVIKFPNFYSDSKVSLDIAMSTCTEVERQTRPNIHIRYIRNSALGVNLKVNMYLQLRGCRERRIVKHDISSISFCHFSKINPIIINVTRVC